MVYDVNDDPLQTSGLDTCVVASRLRSHVMVVASNNKRRDCDQEVRFGVQSFSKLLKAL